MKKMFWLPKGVNIKIPMELPKNFLFWVLVGENDEFNVPNVPNRLDHGYNALLESIIQDYSVIEGQLIYHGYSNNLGVWAVIESIEEQANGRY